MTISSETRKAGPFSGNGVTTAFPFSFKVFAATEVYVVQADEDGIESVLVLNSDYTVALNPNQNTNPGGTVTLSTALPDDFTMVVTSDIEYLQPTDLTNQGGFYPNVINNALDRLTILVQQLREDVSRSAKLPITNPAASDSLVADIVRLADSAAQIDTVAGSIGDVNTVADNIVDIQNAEENATAAANSAAAAAATYDQFDDRYLGAKSSNPTVDNDGNALLTGAIYWNTTDAEMRVWTGTEWRQTVQAPDTLSERNFLATAGQTSYTFTGGYRVGYTFVYVNGSMLYPDDITATNGTTITFAVPLALNDEVRVLSFKAVGTVGIDDITNLQVALDAKATQQTFTGISAPSSGWAGTGPYTNVITVTGLLATDSPIVDINLSGVTYADVEDVQADWGLVYRVAATANNQLTLYATDEPTENFTLTVKVVR
jgi:hypothetical protein